MRSRVLPSTAGVRVRSAAPRPLALTLHNRQVQDRSPRHPHGSSLRLATSANHFGLVLLNCVDRLCAPAASTDRAFCLSSKSNLPLLCSAGAPPALLLSSASACPPRLPACLLACSSPPCVCSTARAPSPPSRPAAASPTRPMARCAPLAPPPPTGRGPPAFPTCLCLAPRTQRWTRPAT